MCGLPHKGLKIHLKLPRSVTFIIYACIFVKFKMALLRFYDYNKPVMQPIVCKCYFEKYRVTIENSGKSFTKNPVT